MSKEGLVTKKKFRLKENVEDISLDRIEALSILPNRGDRALNFFIPRTSNRCINFTHIQLHLKLRLVADIDGNKMDNKFNSIIPGFVPCTIFQNMSIKCNDTEIFGGSHYPQLSKFLFLTQVEESRRRQLFDVNSCQGWDAEDLDPLTEVVFDDPPPAKKGKAGKNNKAKADEEPKWSFESSDFPNYGARSNGFKLGRTVCYSTYLITDLAGGEKDLVLPPCDLAIEFSPIEAARAILSNMDKSTARVEITGAYLTVPRILPKTGMVPRSLRWNFLRTKVTPLVVPKGQQEFHAVVLHSGSIGRRYSLFLIPEANWEGDYHHSPYRSNNSAVESIEFRVGSRVLPSTRIRADFKETETSEMFMYVMDSLKHSLRKTKALELVSWKEWSRGGNFVFSADATVDLSADAGYKGEEDTGSVNLSMSFKEKTQSNLIVAVITETTAELRISNNGVAVHES